MTAEQVALDHYRQRRELADAAAQAAGQAWSQIDPADIVASWAQQSPALQVTVAGAQLAAAQTADGYLDQVLDEQDIDPASAGRVQPRQLAGVASDGRELVTLLDQPVITTLVGIQGGAPVAEALAAGRAALDMIVRTQVADAGRVADQVGLVARRGVGGYVRMLNPPSCSRCVVLAGRWYRWNAGFDRHPSCDCVHIPAAEADSGDLRVNPSAYFRSLSEDEQVRVFTKAGARAIRDGANLNQVVNARRGARGLTPAGARITAEEARMLREGRAIGRLQRTSVFGQQVFVTSEGVTTRGLAGQRLGARETGVKAGGRYRSSRTPRLMPESIYEAAGNDRDEAIRLLRRFGYII